MAITEYGQVKAGDKTGLKERVRQLLEMLLAAHERLGFESISLIAIAPKEDGDRVVIENRFFVQCMHMDYVEDTHKAMIKYLEESYKVTVAQLRKDREQARQVLEREMADMPPKDKLQ